MKVKVLPLFLPRAYVETASSAAVLAWAHGQMTETHHSLIYAVFVFFGTWTVYNLLRVVSLFRRVQSVANWRTVPDLLFVPLHIAVATISGITAFVLLFFQHFDFNGVLFISVLFFITLSYRFRWFRWQGRSVALSELPHVKSFLVAAVWTLLCAVIPLNLDLDFGLWYLGMFLYFFGLTIPFDIRDFERDEQSRKTIPQVIGIHKARSLSLILILVAHILFTYQMQCSIWIFAASALWHAFLISRVCPKTEKAVIYRLLDASPILIGLGMVL